MTSKACKYCPTYVFDTEDGRIPLGSTKKLKSSFTRNWTCRREGPEMNLMICDGRLLGFIEGNLLFTIWDRKVSLNRHKGTKGYWVITTLENSWNMKHRSSVIYVKSLGEQRRWEMDDFALQHLRTSEYAYNLRKFNEIVSLRNIISKW